MRDEISVFLMVGIVISFCSLTTLAKAEEQKAQSYVAVEWILKPGKAGDFEASWKEGVDECKKQNYYLPIYAYSMDDFHFCALYPVEIYSGIDDFSRAYIDHAKKMGMEKLQKIREPEYASIEYSRVFLIRYRSDLSYIPDKPRLKPEDANFIYIALCYVKPGKENEFEKICKERVTLDKSINRADGYDTFVGDIGTEMPFYFWVARTKNPADFWRQDEEYAKKAGEEKIMELWNRTIALCRKLEYKTGWFRPELSYIPKEK